MRLGVAATVSAIAFILAAMPAQAQTPPTVTSTLPAWRAPGGLLSVRGTAAPGAAVELWLGAARRAERTAGPGGRFAFSVRAPGTPRDYAVAVVSEGIRVEAGRLPVRPVRIAAGGDVNRGAGVGEAMRRYGTRWPWLSVAPVLRRADIAVVNLEACVSNPAARCRTRSSTSAARRLRSGRPGGSQAST